VRPSLLDSARIRRHLADRLLISVATPEKRVALTFDDGPNSRHTPELLDLLGEHGVRVTFFLVGRRVRQFPDLARRIVAEGHEVGNHGMHHLPLVLLPPPLLRREVEAAGSVIETVTGVRPRYFRPPMGWFTDRALATIRGLGYEPVIGNIHPRDSSRPGTGRIVDHVLTRVSPGSIIILHDGGWVESVDRSQSIRAVGTIVQSLEDRGYRFATLSELVDEEKRIP
jgi:peptidoglycan/xylan/chitin deacetylase (PgdA/CDA1 family)